jgi:branched-chain amino acid transport system ATP-binding protein
MEIKMSNKLLSVENLTMKFGGLIAIDSLSFSAQESQITSIIGPNGAGKTTVFNCLTGFYKPSEGEMLLYKDDNTISLKKYTDFKISYKAKVARTFQNIRLFSSMSVLENLLVAQHNELMVASGYSIFGLLNLKRYKDKEREAVEKAKYWLDLTGLTSRADDNAGDLSYGDQRKLEIIRAMCTNPKLLCLDEPAAGLNPKESSELNKLLRFIKTEKKTGILLIEHDMSVVMGISDHVVVLNYGKKIFEGTAKESRNSKEVIEAYLGVEE